jgi:hypothetical protein
LDAQPSADVVFTITSNDTSEGTPDISTLTFTSANWDTPQTITVTGADDTLIDGDIPLCGASGGGYCEYAGCQLRITYLPKM